MNQSDFNLWYEYHGKAFPGIKKFVAENDSFEAWYRVLSTVSLSEAKEATDEIFAITPHPYFSEHPAKVKAIAVRGRQKPSEGWTQTQDYKEQRFKCHKCRDTGCVTVFHPMAYKAIRERVYETAKHLRTINVACDQCDKGLAKESGRPDESDWNKRVAPMLKLSPVMLKVPDVAQCPEGQTWTEYQESVLFDFVTNRIQPKGFYQEFAQYA